MKKFALTVLSVFALLGGILFSACGKKVELSVSDDNVVICTNYEIPGSAYKSQDINVTLHGSDDGVYAEIVKGNDVVSLENATPVSANRVLAKHVSGDNYTFSISSISEQTGPAQVKVFSVEDPSKSQDIFVTVNSVISDITVYTQNTQNRFVIKGERKHFDVKDVFELKPLTANIFNLEWSIVNGNEFTSIEDGWIYVDQNFVGDSIVVQVRNPLNNKSATAEFKVLDPSMVKNLTVGGEVLCDDEVWNKNEQAFELRRNEYPNCLVSGNIEVDTTENIDLGVSVTDLSTGRILEKNEYEKYFKFNVTSALPVNKPNTFGFNLNANDDNSAEKLIGNFSVNLQIIYKDVNYAKTISDANIILNLVYGVESLELYSGGRHINDKSVNIFNSYTQGNEFLLEVDQRPSEIGLDSMQYYIEIDTNQNNLRDNLLKNTDDPISAYLANFSYNGSPLEFSSVDGTIYRSNNLMYGMGNVAIKTSEGLLTNLEGKNVVIKVVPLKSPAKFSTFSANFYKIAYGDNLTVSGAEPVRYISSSLQNTLSYELHVSGLSSAESDDFSIVSNGDNRIAFSEIKTESGNGEVVLRFDAVLNANNFAGNKTFYIRHITGKRSQDFQVVAFVPLESASVVLENRTSSSVFAYEEESQNFALSVGTLTNSSNAQNSMSNIMVEAGASLDIVTNYQALSQDGISYRFLNLTQLVVDGNITSERADEIFAYDLNDFATHYGEYLNLFTNNFRSYLSMTETSMRVGDTAFKGWIGVFFNGYASGDNDTRQEITLARFFKIESFYSVNQFYSNVRSKVLYTNETLSAADEGMSIVDVTVTLRTDQKIPTYKEESRFVFSSALSTNTFSFSDDLDDYNENSNNFGSVYGGFSNGYYSVTDFRIYDQSFVFKIQALSTKFNATISDVLTITYTDPCGETMDETIRLNIQNVTRVEGVEWINSSGEVYDSDDNFIADGEIYLDLYANELYGSNERNYATILTAVSPSNAYDKTLSYLPIVTGFSFLNIDYQQSGQTFTFDIDSSLLGNDPTGGQVFVYLLPNDMKKTNSLMLYFFDENDENGKPVYLPISALDQKNYYAIINGGIVSYQTMINGTLSTINESVSNYFYSYDIDEFGNSVRNKVFNKDVLKRVLVTLADGRSEETAIRIYSAEDFERIRQNPNLFYRIENNITLSSWKSLENFSGTIFGANENVTITISGESFVDNLTGTIKNLIFAGAVESDNSNVGFLANENNGIIENVAVDVLFADGKYQPSSVKSTNAVYVGGLVGVNNNLIKDSKVLGVDISANSYDSFIGGIAGQNYASITGCSVEFYRFEGEQPNKFSGGQIGGLVGQAYTGSTIEKSYVYAYPLEESNSVTILTQPNSNAANSQAYAFIAEVVENGENPSISVSESFAFVGQNSLFSQNNNANLILSNCYITYINGAYKSTHIYGNQSEHFELSQSDIGNTSNWQDAVAELDSSIWQLENIDQKVNFGYMYLKNVQQTVAVDPNDVKLRDRCESANEYLQMLKSSNGGILFFFEAENAIPNSQGAALSALKNLNTLSISDILEVEKNQTQSLLLFAQTRNISFNATSIEILGKQTVEFELSVHSKMDFSKSQPFKFVIINNLPDINLTSQSSPIFDQQHLLIQKGLQNELTFGFDNSVVLAGNITEMADDTCDVKWQLSYQNENLEDNNDYVLISKASSNIVLIGKKATTNSINVEVGLNINELAALNEGYQNAVYEAKLRKFDFSVYDGARKLNIKNASSMEFEISQSATFDVVVESDNQNENLTFQLANQISDDEIVYFAAETTQNSTTFKVDEKLSVVVSWSKQSQTNPYEYHVVVQVSEESLYLVDETYRNLILTVRPTSFSANRIESSLLISILPQQAQNLDIATYNISSRQILNSVTYYRVSNSYATEMMPGSEIIVGVNLFPAYSVADHFNLTYETTFNSQGQSNTQGSVFFSRLEQTQFGYRGTSLNTTNLPNGISVKLSQEDKRGNGVFYFRMYVTSGFSLKANIILTATCFKTALETAETQALTSVTRKVVIDAIAKAEITVGGVSGAYFLAKGTSAEVEVTLEQGEQLNSLTLSDNIGINSSGRTINLSSLTVSGNKVRATLSADIDAFLQSSTNVEQKTGRFEVNAQVQRIINGVVASKTSTAYVYLVDFALNQKSDANGNATVDVSLQGGRNTIVYDDGFSNVTSDYEGQTFDVYYAYRNATTNLVFEYGLTPDEDLLNAYRTTNSSAVAEIESKQDEFLRNNFYQDKDGRYYINVKDIKSNGEGTVKTLKEQLECYVYNEAVREWRWESVFPFAQNGGYATYFTMQESVVSNSQTTSRVLQVTGKQHGNVLMRLVTTVTMENETQEYPYYFVINVDTKTDVDNPIPIYTAKEFLDIADSQGEAKDYILMNDIVLDDYAPRSTGQFASLDGNGFTIHINSFEIPESGSELRLALFDTVTSNTTLKNIRVNLYAGGQIKVDISRFDTVNIAGFAVDVERDDAQSAIIYNCEVVSYFDSNYQPSGRIPNPTGLVVKYVRGNNDEEVKLSNSSLAENNVAGFVINNYANISNCRVGGEEFLYSQQIGANLYLMYHVLDMFTLSGQGDVAGFVVNNQSDGYVSASYAKNIQINNNMNLSTSSTAGFVVLNSGKIQNSYVEGHRIVQGNGDSEDSDNSQIVQITGSRIKSQGRVGGFTFENEGEIRNSYSNIAITATADDSSDTIVPSLAAGFVFQNDANGNIELCYTASYFDKALSSQMPFAAFDEDYPELNNGTISNSYYYSSSEVDETNQRKVVSGVRSVWHVLQGAQDEFYGFSFSNGDNYDGVWEITQNGITLVSANKIAFSKRYAVVEDENTTRMYYYDNIIDSNDLLLTDISYGSEKNPIILRNAEDFAYATGSLKDGENILSYSKHFNNVFDENNNIVGGEVFGAYRIVANISLDDLNGRTDNLKITTTAKTFSGILDGNGYAFENIFIGSTNDSGNQNVQTDNQDVENFGLFAKFDGAVVMNLDFTVTSVQETRANVVGTLAGSAFDTRILAITLSTSEDSDDNQILDYISGRNISGGVVGMLLGESYLSDITVFGLRVGTAYDRVTKEVSENDEKIERLRNITASTQIKDIVNDISYAGGVVGYMDIYKHTNNQTVRYSQSLDMEDFNVVTVHLKDSVDVYGQVVGGLFGFVGDSTYIYDANIELSDASYITSSSLYAGGLVGEFYGAMKASYATYSQEIQDMIERQGTQNAVNNYYQSGSATERGQNNIFSSARANNRLANPRFVGGVVGYMGGGFIEIAYSKLNVISHSNRTQAVGGVVGLAGSNGNVYANEDISGAPFINIYLRDVYASGDLYADGVTEDGSLTAVSGGIIGGLYYSDLKPVVAMHNVLAVNYLSVVGSGDQTHFAGDNTTSFDENRTATSSNHFMIAGKIFTYKENTYNTDETLSSNFILVHDGTGNSYDEFNTDTNHGGTNNITVGGYSSYQFNGQTLNLDAFGFEYDRAAAVTDSIRENIEHLLPISDINMTTIADAYANLATYFLESGWNHEYWVHDALNPTLYPYISFNPIVEVVFWDSDVGGTERVLTALKNDPKATIVVRGRINPDNVAEGTKDIDLTNETTLFNETYWSTFQGTLMSYYEYMHSDEEGLITESVSNGGAETTNTNRDQAARAGIITNRSLFQNLDNATLIGLNIYFVKSENSGSEDEINYSLVGGEIKNSEINKVNLVYNSDVEITAVSKKINNSADAETLYVAGLVGAYANSTNFVENKVTLRNSATVKFVQGEEDTDYGFSAGLLVGALSHISTGSTTVDGIEVVRETSNQANENADKECKIIFEKPSSTPFYGGLYAGKILREGDATKLVVSVHKLKDVSLTLQYSKEETTSDKIGSVMIGGFVGQTINVSNVLYKDTKTSLQNSDGVVLNLSGNIDHVDAGLVIGKAERTLINLQSETAETIKGAIYQVSTLDSEGNKKTTTFSSASIGAIAGMSSSGSANVQNVSVDFTVRSKDGTEDAQSKDVDFESNQIDYSKDIRPIIVNGGNLSLGSGLINNEEINTAIGGYVGYTNSSSFTLSGVANINGQIQVASSYRMATSGAVGYASGPVSISANSQNNINISVSKFSDVSSTTKETVPNPVSAYVGGFVGKIIGGEGSGRTFSVASTSGSARFDGNVLSSVEDLYFGGIVGQVESQFQTINISTTAFGGAVKIYGSQEDSQSSTATDGAETNVFGNSIKNSKVAVGGIVGSLQATKDTGATDFTIQNSATYGDVFVMYDVGNFDRLTQYTFGGIAGTAQNVNISGCATMMTSFNSRIATDTDGYQTNVNAIVGIISDGAGGSGASTVSFNNNFYSSAVMMAYQADKGNVDLAYHKSSSDTPTYIGYVSSDGDVNLSELEGNIVDKITSIITALQNESFGEGTKMHPKEANYASESNIFDSTDSRTTTHNIYWTFVAPDNNNQNGISIGSIKNLTNAMIVGDGNTITVKDTADKSGILGGLVNTIGNEQANGRAKKGEVDTTCTNADFAGITGLVLDMQISNTDFTEKATFGGVAGQMYGNAFIYAVCVDNQISLGATESNKAVVIGGMIGEMHEGYIAESYVGANMTYRAGNDGKISGITNVADKANATIRATYTSGMIETYVDVDISTFVGNTSDINSTESTDKANLMVVDSYTYASVKQNIALTEANINSTPKDIKFIDNQKVSNSDSSKFEVMTLSTYGQVLNASYDGGSKYAIGGLAVGYNPVSTTNKMAIREKLSHEKNDIGEGEKFNTNTYTPWYYSAYTNSGYASHGFGWLKNVSVWKQETGKQNDVGIVLDNSYSKVLYNDLFDEEKIDTKNSMTTTDESKDKLFLGVPNAGKLEQLEGLGTGYSKNLRFVLTNDIDLSKYYNNIKTSGTINIDYLGKAVGKADKDFIFDGDNHAIDFGEVESTSGLFGSVNGRIENLRIVDINVNFQARDITDSGTLARSLVGSMSNISVVGNLQGSGSTVGGVVGTLSGSATAVESLVNITKTTGGIVGGIVGTLQKQTEDNKVTINGADQYVGGVEDHADSNGVKPNTNGAITYSSSNGQIIVTGTGSASKSFNALKRDTTEGSKTFGEFVSDTNKNFNNVVGGIAGYVNVGTIDHSYNANSVLDGFTNSGTNGNSATGGIAGYVENGTITSSYNAGFIGAGNYGTTSDYVFSGGIFGYSNGIMVSDCENEGQVEAINGIAMTTRDRAKVPQFQQIDIKKSSEAPEENNYQKSNIPSLSYDVTLTYNVGQARQVYAYGIGFAGYDGTTDGTKTEVDNTNKSTTDNIKNDGNIGEFSQTQTITFDRQGILDNGNGAYPFWGKFEVDRTATKPNVYVNGYDSYGFANRLYMKDTITRVYADRLNGADGSVALSGDITGVENNLTYWTEKFPQQVEWTSDMFSANTTYKYDSSKGLFINEEAETSAYQGDSGGPKFDKNGSIDWLPYLMEQETDYWSSASFVSYEEVLKDFPYQDMGLFKENDRVGLVGYNANEEENRLFGEENPSVSEEMSKIDTTRERNDEFDTTTINGESTAIVSSATNMKAIFAPYMYTVTATFSHIPENITISKNNFTLSGADDAAFKILKSIKMEGGTEATVTYEIYYEAEQSNTTFEISLTYQQKEDIKLFKNNIILNGQNYLIFLEDEEGQTVFTREIVESINSEDDPSSGQSKYNFGNTNGENAVVLYNTDNIPIYNFSPDDVTINYLDGIEDYDGRRFSDVAYLIIDKNSINNISSVKSVELNYNIKTISTSTEINYNVLNNFVHDINHTFDFTDISTTVASYEDYQVADFTASWSENTFDLSHLATEVEKEYDSSLATYVWKYENEKTLTLTHNGSEWKIWDGTASRDTITVTYAENELTLTISENILTLSGDGEDFKTNFFNSFSGTAQNKQSTNWTFNDATRNHYNDPQGLPDGLQITYKAEPRKHEGDDLDGFDIVNSGDHYTATYNGELNDLRENAYIKRETKSIAGLNFVEIKVNFFTKAEVKLADNYSANQGYLDATLNSVDISQILKQGSTITLDLDPVDFKSNLKGKFIDQVKLNEPTKDYLGQIILEYYNINNVGENGEPEDSLKYYIKSGNDILNYLFRYNISIVEDIDEKVTVEDNEHKQIEVYKTKIADLPEAIMLCITELFGDELKLDDLDNETKNDRIAKFFSYASYSMTSIVKSSGNGIDKDLNFYCGKIIFNLPEFNEEGNIVINADNDAVTHRKEVFYETRDTEFEQREYGTGVWYLIKRYAITFYNNDDPTQNITFLMHQKYDELISKSQNGVDYVHEFSKPEPAMYFCYQGDSITPNDYNKEDTDLENLKNLKFPKKSFSEENPDFREDILMSELTTSGEGPILLQLEKFDSRGGSYNICYISESAKLEYNLPVDLTGDSIKAYSGQESIKNTDYFGEDRKNFKYSKDYGDWQDFNGEVFADKYGGQDFSVRYDVTKTTYIDIESSDYVNLRGESNNKYSSEFANILIDGDLHLDVTLNDSSYNFLGNKHIFKTIGQENENMGMFAGTGKLQDLNFVGVFNLDNMTKSQSILNLKTYSKNINLFGSVRNVKADASGDVTPISGTMTEKDGTNIKNTTDNIKSYVTIVGLDGALGEFRNANGGSAKNVSVAIKDNWSENNIEDKHYTSKSILIAGNGANGRAGFDATSIGGKGYEGESGGNGGSITIGDQKFEGYVREGIGGVGGYGGNGQNGRFVGRVAKGGGAAGNAGGNGTYGKIQSTDEKSIKNIAKRLPIDPNTNKVNPISTTMTGNGGIGGFGRIDATGITGDFTGRYYVPSPFAYSFNFTNTPIFYSAAFANGGDDGCLYDSSKAYQIKVAKRNYQYKRVLVPFGETVNMDVAKIADYEATDPVGHWTEKSNNGFYWNMNRLPDLFGMLIIEGPEFCRNEWQNDLQDKTFDFNPDQSNKFNIKKFYMHLVLSGDVSWLYQDRPIAGAFKIIWSDGKEFNYGGAYTSALKIFKDSIDDYGNKEFTETTFTYRVNVVN